MKNTIIIIGGGPAGLMAAVAASTHGGKVILIEKGEKLGRKLAISGGGRCNVTNRVSNDELIRHIPGNGKFMHSPFSIFNNEDIIHFFESLGVELKEEDHGRMFPKNDKAIEVVRTLLNEIRQLGVEIRTKSEVKDISLSEDGEKVEGVLLKSGEIISGDRVIIASGGKSVPYTGSTGDGYPWAAKAGHTITDLYPTEVPIVCKDKIIHEKSLQGLSLREVSLTVHDPKKKNKKIKTHTGDMIFTHFGISGPIGLRCSQYVVKTLKKYDAAFIPLTIDLFPELAKADVQTNLEAHLSSSPKKTIKNGLNGFIPERLIPFLLELTQLKEDEQVQTLSRNQLLSIVQILKELPFSASGTLSIEKAFVTGGGVSVKEVMPKRMESKLVSGLFFCGEILDLHGYTGGYNITVAFSTGYTAGKAAAED